MTSSIENLFWPPFVESFAVSCQSFDGKEAEFEVSTKRMRRVVFLEANRVEAERFAIHTIEANARAAIDDQIVCDHLILRCSVSVLVIDFRGGNS